jgi:hypothetical protein
MNLKCIVGAYGSRELNIGFLLDPMKETFDGLSQAVDGAIIVLFPGAQLLTFEFFLWRLQRRSLRCQHCGQRGIGVGFVAKFGIESIR